jgi:hypothetical protein
MRFLTAVAFGSLFLTASAGLLMTGLLIASDAPWQITPAYKIDRIVADAKAEHPELLIKTFTDIYRFVALSMYLAAVLVLLIIFFAPKSRPLIFSTLLSVVIFFGTLHHFFEPLAAFSEHRRLFWFAYISNGLGLFVYSLHCIYKFFFPAPRLTSVRPHKD